MIVNYHSLFFALGALSGLIVYIRLNNKLSVNSLVQDYFWALLFGLLGARLAYSMFFGFASFLELVAFWQVGLISYGGIILGLVVFYLRQSHNPHRSDRLDTFVISIALAWTVGRLGNYFEQDAYGVVNESFSLFYNRVPISLFESLVAFILFITCLNWWRQGLFTGKIAWIIFTLYFLARFIIDFYRDLPPYYLNLNISQLVALLLAVCGIILISYEQRKKK